MADHPSQQSPDATSPAVGFHDPAGAADTRAHAASPAEEWTETHHADPHGHGEYEHIHEVPNVLTLLRNGPFLRNPAARTALTVVEPVFFSLLVTVALALAVRRLTRRMALVPTRGQNAVELAVEALARMVYGVMGERYGRRHLPFVASLFFFILFNNLLGLVPGAKAPTSMFQTTIALGICAFFYVQISAIRMNGFRSYVHHLMGEPEGAAMWALAPFMLLLEVIGELVKPLSLSLRLFGNIRGEDTLLYVMSLVGLIAIESLRLYIPIPLQLPFFFLALLAGSIQALVFAMLVTVYISLFIPHRHEARYRHTEPSGSTAAAEAPSA